jgi:hypothetical protein
MTASRITYQSLNSFWQKKKTTSVENSVLVSKNYLPHHKAIRRAFRVTCLVTMF